MAVQIPSSVLAAGWIPFVVVIVVRPFEIKLLYSLLLSS